MSPVFHPFTSEHFAAVATGAAVTAGLIAMGRTGHRGQLVSTGILAFLNLAAFAIMATGLGVDSRELSDDPHRPSYPVGIA